MAGGLPPAPRWAWIVMALGVVAIGVLSYLAVNRPPPPGFTAPSAAASPTSDASPASATTSASASADPTETADESRILVIGDAYTAGSAESGAGAVGWPQLVADRLQAAGRPVAVDVAAARGSGYVAVGPDGATFAQLVEGTGEDYDLVVFFGSQHDTAAAPEVQAAATAAFSAAQAKSPGAPLLVVGPMWLEGDPPGYILTNRDTTAAAAAEVGATFVDPLTEAWLTGPDGMSAGGGGLTDEGHRTLADRMRPPIENALPEPS